MKGTPYPVHKPSGIDWLEDIPAHWDVRRLKSVCCFTYGDTLTAEMRNDGDVPVYGSNGQVGVHSAANTKSPCIVIGRKGSFGKINYVQQPAFAIDTTYFVDERHSQNDLRWLFYLLGWLRLDDVTKDSAIPGLGREDAYQRIVPVPPLDEQATLVRQLDQADDRIQQTISAKERLIELLTEQRQAIINHAVTRGLDPNVPLKDSGVEWLGDVPAHWEMKRGKRLFSKMERAVRKYDDVVTCFRDGIVTLRKNRRELGFTESLKEIGYQGIRDGDLVIHSMDAFAGAVGVSDSDGKGTPVYSVCKPGPEADSYFYAYHLREMARTKWIQALSKGIRQRSSDFRYSDFGAQILPLPPLTEQTAIVRYLDKATAAIDTAINKAQLQIDLLREYRTRLIADVVTGQVDVRDAVVN